MKKRSSVFSIRYFPVLLLFAFAGYHVYDSVQRYAVYRYDGMCLKHRRGEVEFPEGNYFASRTMPMFWMLLPDDYPDEISADGATVQFRKGKSVIRERHARGENPFANACGVLPHAHGLDEQVSSGNSTCPASKSHRRFVPASKTEPFYAVTISCATNPDVVNCSLNNYMENGWIARVGFPKQDLSHWQALATAAETFFREKLTDCGENS